MTNFCSFLNKSLLLLYEVKIEGQICGGLIHKKRKRLQFFSVHSKEDTTYIQTRKIRFFGDDALVAMNKFSLIRADEIDFSNLVPCPIGHMAYTTDGRYIGQVDDFELNEEFFVVNLFVAESTIPIENVVSFGQKVVLIKGEWSPKRISRPTPKKIKQNDKRIVTILDDELQDEYPIVEPISLSEAIKEEHDQIVKEISLLESDDEHDASRVPQRILSGYEFLLGRIVTRNIFSFNRKLLAMRGEVVTATVVERAKSAGKLVELTLHSKKI